MLLIHKTYNNEIIVGILYSSLLKIEENILKGSVNNEVFLEFEDKNTPLEYGGIGLIVESGTQSTDEIIVG